MTDRQEVGGSPGPAPGASTAQWSNSASEAIHAWLNDFARAAKSFRVYADNNEMLNRLVDRAARGLEVILQSTPELNLSVRADRLLAGKDPVHINSDRDDGLPFTLYRNAFRRITFLEGFQRSELVDLMRALSADYTGGTEQLGEDLVAALWRLALPHLRYITIDAFSVAASDVPSDVTEQIEIERIQESVEDIVAAVYRSNASDEDIVPSVSITKEDLEAFRRIREENGQDLDVTDQATARVIVEISPEELEPVAKALEQDTRDALVHRVVDILIHILFQEPSGTESARTIGLIQQLFDSMVLARRFSDATELIERLRITADRSESLQEVHIARHLIRMFASEQRIGLVVEALEERSASVQDKVRFLRVLGPDTRSVLLDSLDSLSQPGHRRLLIDLIREFGAPPVAELQRRLGEAKWFVARDLLSLSQAYPLDMIGPLVVSGLGHEHPKVRQHAIGLLRGYGPGLADQLLAERLADEDSEVRLAAMRVAAARKSAVSCKVLEDVLESEDLHERQPKELRTLMAAYAAIAGTAAVPVLGRVLNPGFFTRLKGTEPQVAAAFALASIGPAAHAVLERGARTLNARVRDACRSGLSPRESEDLPAVLLGMPELSPPGPAHPGSQDSWSPLVDLEDVETFVGSKVIAGRPLPEGPGPDLRPTAAAPAALLDLTEPLPERRARPVLPRVDVVRGQSERIPSNLPPVRAEMPLRDRESGEVLGPSSQAATKRAVSLSDGPPSASPAPVPGETQRRPDSTVDDELKAYLEEMRAGDLLRDNSESAEQPPEDELPLDSPPSKGPGS